MTKDKNEVWKKFYKLINKYLKKEVEDIGIKIYKYLLNLVNVHPNKIFELNIRAFTELLIFINDNTQRIIEIWNININNDKQEKKLIKNSIEILGYFTYVLLCSFTTYNPYIKSNNQDIDYLNEVKQQCLNYLKMLKKL